MVCSSTWYFASSFHTLESSKRGNHTNSTASIVNSLLPKSALPAEQVEACAKDANRRFQNRVPFTWILLKTEKYLIEGLTGFCGHNGHGSGKW